MPTPSSLRDPAQVWYLRSSSKPCLNKFFDNRHSAYSRKPHLGQGDSTRRRDSDFYPQHTVNSLPFYRTDAPKTKASGLALLGCLSITGKSFPTVPGTGSASTARHHTTASTWSPPPVRSGALNLTLFSLFLADSRVGTGIRAHVGCLGFSGDLI